MAILPGNTLGILGGGQLGRMFVIAAKTMGYEVTVLDPDPNSPAGSLASEHLAADYTDTGALDKMAGTCSVVTTEFENIPSEALDYLAKSLPVHPSASALKIAQNRIREKTFIQSMGLDTPHFIAIESEQDLPDTRQMTYPAILKTATLGYDGKGQFVCSSQSEVEKAFKELGTQCVLEQLIELEKEISVVLARSEDGRSFCFPAAENHHVNGILDSSIVPARVTPQQEEMAHLAAIKIADGMQYCGVMAVEFFISTAGQLLVNEIAPRPHNSGHYTLDACYASQFEQQVRMICGLPSANCELHTPVAMWNILGDIWPPSGVPDWEEVLKIDRASLHLYGKQQARKGRKMGHINFLVDDISEAENQIYRVRNRLTR